MAWWSSWYESSVNAVGAAWDASQATVSSLFKGPTYGSGTYQPDDVSVSDVVRERRSQTPSDLYPVNPGPFDVTTDIQQAIMQRPKTWDEMSWWEKAKTYVGIAPGAIADTIGISDRPGASTPVSGPSGGIQSIGGAISNTADRVGEATGRVVSSTLGLGPGGIGGFLGSTLAKVIIGLVVIVVGLYFVLKIQARVAA